MNIQESYLEQPISSTQINVKIISAILLVQIFTMVSAEIAMPDIDPYIETLFASILFVVIASPVIYFFIAKPLVMSRKYVENKLRAHQEDFEQQVFSRTRELEASESHKSKLLDSVADAILYIDDNQNIVMYNKNAELLFGYKSKEIVGQSLLELIPIKSKTSHNAKFEQYFDKVKTNSKLKLRGTILAKPKSGSTLSVEICMTQMKMDGKVLFSIIIHDVTTRVKHEHSLIKAKEKAEHSDQEKSEFLAKMTHELRTPMHSIVSFSALGIKKITSAPTEKLQQYFQSIHDSGQRMLKLINGLLDISKMEANKMVLQYAAGNLRTISEKCLGEIHSQLQDKKLKYELNVHEVVPVSLCDKEKIHQVILNLLSNSMKFSPRSGVIRINITAQMLPPKTKKDQATPGIQLCVSDQGKGIAKEELKTIFDKYVQSKNNDKRVGGTGLGLAISKEVIELHKGYIWAEQAADGHGAVICFQIPINTR